MATLKINLANLKKCRAGHRYSQTLERCAFCVADRQRTRRSSVDARNQHSDEQRALRADTRYAFKDALRRYQLDVHDYALMCLSQRFRCAACFDELEFDNSRRVHVDHCHRSGRVRGLLCSGCNVALGYVKESSEALRRLADYIERQHAPWTPPENKKEETTA